MLGSKCLRFIQLRIIFAPQIVSILLNRIGPFAVIVIVLSFFDSHFFHLGHPLAGDIPSMFLCIVDARPEGWSFRFVVDLPCFEVHCILAMSSAWTFQSPSIPCDTDLTGSPMVLASFLPIASVGARSVNNFEPDLFSIVSTDLEPEASLLSLASL